MWAALARFAEAYVGAYYRSDAEVRADVELQAFVREVGAQDGGRLPAMFAQYRVDSIASLAAMVARVLYRASAYHIAINNGNYDWAGYAPNASTAGFAGLPPYGALDASFLPAMLPDEKIAFEAISATWQVTQLALNKLGEYGPSNVADPAITPAIDELERGLVAIEQQINERNTRRPLAYTYLLPSRITASINA